MSTRWLYLYGGDYSSVVAYANGIGFIYTNPVFWKWYYDYGSGEWKRF